MPKFARPNSYNGRQSNSDITGSTRAAQVLEALSGINDQIYISPFTLEARLTSAPAVTGASPLISNNKIGQAIFTGVNIAAGLTQSFTITNSQVLATTDIILVQIYGATDGAALNIKSVTPIAGSFTVVVSNGAGATTSIDNLTVTFQLL